MEHNPLIDDSAELRPIGWTGPTGAMVVRHLRAWCPLDNHIPARRETIVMMEEYHWPLRDDGYSGYEVRIIGGLDAFPKGAHALWIMDEAGKSRVMHTAGWHETHRYIALKSFPAGLLGGFGPRIAYHLMTTDATMENR